MRLKEGVHPLLTKERLGRLATFQAGLEKVCIIFIKNKNLKTPKKAHF